MNFYEHRKIRLSRELRNTLVLIVAQSAEQHVMQKTTYYHISLNLIKIHKTADYPFLFADLIFF